MTAHAIQDSLRSLAITHGRKPVEKSRRRNHPFVASDSNLIANAWGTGANSASPKNEPEWQGQWRVLKYL